ncbi:MAG: chemotaxis protein CheD [Nitrospirota bacterium]|jgi:chemotaxis protein CheD
MPTAEKIVVGIGDLQLSREPGAVLITHGLGSCIGVAIYDPVTRVGGLLHYMLPEVEGHEEKAAASPLMFGETGIPRLFHGAYAIGAMKSRVIVKIAGGASLIDANGVFNVGKRNFLLARKLLWKNGMAIAAEDVGESSSRTMELEVDSGRVWITSPGRGRKEL